jgi:fibronectin-binding autotransporter adhesin
MPAKRSFAPQSPGRSRRRTAPASAQIVLVALLAWLAVPGRAGADATTLCLGPGHGCFKTLKAAVDAAHDGSTIKIAPGTYRGGVVVARSVRLAGSGAGRTVIRGGGPVLTLGGAISVSGVTVTGGVTSANPHSPGCGPDVPACGPGYAEATALGGGIEALPGSTVTLRRTVVADNRAAPSHTVASVKATCPDGPCPASFGDAAGIDNWGTMRLIGSVVRDNHAAGAQSQGGGIVSEAGASLALEHSLVARNRAAAIAPYGRFANGGGIFVDAGGTLTVDRSAITGNRASLANSIPHPYPQQDGGTDGGAAIGGGIFIADGAGASIRHSRLDGNEVTVDAPLGEPFGDAAALCSCTELPLTITDTSIAGNRLTVHVVSSDDNGPSGPAALDSGGPTTILRTSITGNDATIAAATGGAGILGTIGFFSGGTQAVTITDSAVTSNRVAALAPAGAATVQGAGITNAGPLVLDHALIHANRGTASGRSGLAQGAGIWNGEIFGIPTAPPTLRHTRVTDNVPDQCVGC